MCGIFGVCFVGDSASKEDWTVQQMATLMFPAIRHRGPHAFGWMTWDGKQVEWDKHQGDVAMMAELAKVKVQADAKWMVCHVRYATHGTPEYNNNNHPIRHGDVLGVHNGSIRNYHIILDETGREDEAAEVDSEAIFAAVDKWGHKPGLRKLSGNMTTVYTKLSNPEHLYFAKSTNYDLVLARTAAGSLVFASELKVLRSAFGKELTDIRMLDQYQLIRVLGGKVAESHLYRKAPAPAPRVLQTPTHYGSGRSWDGHRWEGILNFQAARALEAARRAAITDGHPATPPAPAKRRSKAPRAKHVPQGYRDGMEVSPGKYYYNGLLLTEDEYVDAVAEEAGWE